MNVWSSPVISDVGDEGPTVIPEERTGGLMPCGAMVVFWVRISRDKTRRCNI